MPRYINTENVPALFDEEYKKTRKLIRQGETHLDNLAEGFIEAARVIQRMPTADVVERKRGEWIEKTHDWDFGDYIDYTCSICGIREQNKRKFCPECGADMRGDRDDQA